MPLRTRGYGTRQRVADATMRVSDAERAEVADQLAQHYGDGRLDQAELDERLGRAMGAKTQADLAGITADLPPLDPRAGSRPAGLAAAVRMSSVPAGVTTLLPTAAPKYRSTPARAPTCLFLPPVVESQRSISASRRARIEPSVTP